MRLTMIRNYLAGYQEAKRILAANFTTVQERKAAIDIKNEFVAMAPSLVKELLCGIDDLIAVTDADECADPESCHPRTLWQCARCRIRGLDN